MIALDALKAPGIAHGFFTREGGVSGGIYASLNCGSGSGDDPAAVAENRARAASMLGVARDALATNHQVHGCDIVTVTGDLRRHPRARADGLVTTERGIALGILTADCVPVLFADTEAGVVGAAHAGWRGAVSGVLEATVRAMTVLGAERARIRAGFGPAIAQASYEVGPEFPAPFLAQDPGNERFFVASANAKYHFDLPAYVRTRLERLGLAAVATTGGDTAAEPERFFSYRRSRLAGEPDYGRLLSAIALL
jgi:polyphenol oxidase